MALLSYSTQGQRDNAHCPQGGELFLEGFLHTFCVILGITLFAFLLTLLMLAVIEEGLYTHKHPGESCEGETADEDINEDFGNDRSSHVRTSLSQKLIVIDGAEVFGSIALAAERLTILDLLDVAETAGNTLIAV